MDELSAIADRLYAGPSAGFTQARKEAARAAEDASLAAQVIKLAKPSLAGWVVNVLVRRESSQIDSALELGASLRAAAAALDGDELRSLTRQRRQLTAALTTRARALAREDGVRVSASVADQVEGILTAAMLDPVAAQVVRTGRVLTAFTSTGLSEIDVPAVVALPERLDVRAAPQQSPHGREGAGAGAGAAATGLHVVPDNGARIAAAEDALESATGELRAAQRELEEGELAVEDLNARRLQLQGEADELRRRLATIEEDVDDVDDGLEEAGDACADARQVVLEARGRKEQAQVRLDGLRRGPEAR